MTAKVLAFIAAHPLLLAGFSNPVLSAFANVRYAIAAEVFRLLNEAIGMAGRRPGKSVSDIIAAD
jgi:hypothetical protein